MGFYVNFSRNQVDAFGLWKQTQNRRRTKNKKTENEFLKREKEGTNHCNLLTTAYLVQHVKHGSYQFESTQIFQRSSCHFVVRLSPDPFLEQFCLLVRLLTSVKASFKMRVFRIPLNFDARTGNITRVSQFNICIATVYQPLLVGIKQAFKEQYIKPIIGE